MLVRRHGQLLQSTISHVWRWRILLLFGLTLHGLVSADSAAPIVIAASGSWDGNDGPWSTFNFRVGTQRETVRLLPDFNSMFTTLITAEGCPDVGPVSNCSERRGGIYHREKSSRWKMFSNTTAPPTEGNRQVTGAKEGSDVVLIGPESPTTALNDLPIVLESTMSPFVGSIGLSGANGTDTRPSFLTKVAQTTNIARSWSYTAGCFNRSEPGSLILGGYDASRYVKNSVSPWFKMNDTSGQPLTLRLSDIQFVSVTTGVARWRPPGGAHPAVLDSSTPFLWLSLEACRAFEDKLGLIWDETTQLYTMSEALYSDSKFSQYAFIALGLGDPYAPAVDTWQSFSTITENLSLSISAPLVNSTTSIRYFPLKRMTASEIDRPWIIGRAFMQDLYITANYDQRVFRLAAARYDRNVTPRIVSLDSSAPPPDDAAAPTSPPSPPTENLLMITLIAVAAVIVTFAIGTGCFCIWAYKKKRRPFHRRPDSKRADTEEGALSGETASFGNSDDVSLAHLGAMEIMEAGKSFKLAQLDSMDVFEAEDTSIKHLDSAEILEIEDTSEKVHEMDGASIGRSKSRERPPENYNP
ncbi:hypothetical protein EJ08DRAFT_105204 [Tothia fuscella]|uniref:Peptidase A1 domain-containing protein n=1 Tax=Tothia fuscella TaxID=1048955 RepID=A0A9P4U1J0_9PEZI|nr:hypothetical protein EJ08DRAFT_105204 [Tothia fuscella]